MRWPAILAFAALAAGAEAKPAAPPPEPVASESGDFWRDVVEPHAEVVRKIVLNTRNAMRYADDALQGDSEWAVDQRMRYFQDSYGALRYARRLQPSNAEVLGLFGRAADELGKTRQAIEALEASIAITGPDKAAPEIIGRLGAIYLRLGQRDSAIRWLRLAQGPLRPETVQPLIHLANALASRGEVTDAVDVLLNSVPPQQMQYYSQELSLAMFALAVIYDRDEQRAAAFDVLDRMRATLSHSFAAQMQSVLATMRFAPAEDQHYYDGLLYEVLEQYPEARAAFALYAASGDAPWRERALEHIRDIDAERKKAKPAVKPPPPPPKQTIFRPRHTP